MLISIVVRTKDQAGRLRLVLTSLSRQSLPIVASALALPPGETAAELIIVNDGSRDRTEAVIQEAAGWMPLRMIHHPQSRGLAAASNAGAWAATGDVLLFMDGDTLACPEVAALHARQHAGARAMARGETFHLRCTRFLEDPETGSPQPGQEEHVRRLGSDLVRHLVTRQQVLDHFEEIERRSQPGIYPGAGPRQLFELEFDALQNHSELSVLWMAASGHNLSVRRADFEAVGGFNERLMINEHRELAFRLVERCIPVRAVPGARTYHLTHRSGWRDPLIETEWERIFYEAHPCLAVKLMSIFWMSLADAKIIPREARITSLAQMDTLVRGGTTVDYDAIRRLNPQLAQLGPA